jgi:hypothetical protein
MLALQLFHFEVRQEQNEDQLNHSAGLITSRLRSELRDLNDQLQQFCKDPHLARDIERVPSGAPASDGCPEALRRRSKRWPAA